MPSAECVPSGVAGSRGVGVSSCGSPAEHGRADGSIPRAPACPSASRPLRWGVWFQCAFALGRSTKPFPITAGSLDSLCYEVLARVFLLSV